MIGQRAPGVKYRRRLCFGRLKPTLERKSLRGTRGSLRCLGIRRENIDPELQVGKRVREGNVPGGPLDSKLT